MFSVYILYSSSLSKYYIGYSSDVASRLVYHNSTSNVIWTKRGIPWDMFFEINGLSESQAIRIEKHIKQMKSRKYIDNLRQYPEMADRLKERYG